MTIQRFTPSPSLRPYIKQYYLVNGDFGQKTEDVFFADGCMEIVFNLNLEFYRGDEKEHWAKLIGQITDPLHVKAIGQGKSFGIWFSPQGFSRFSKIPAKEFNNKAVPLDQVFEQDFIDAVGHHLSYSRLENTIQLIDTYFEKQLKVSSVGLKEAVVDHVVNHLSQPHSETYLSDMTRAYNISDRYLQKIFLDKVGVSPKKLQRIMRFQNSLSQIQSAQETAFTSIAYTQGYFDQSHFIREFKSFTGYAPSQYQTHQHPINQYFLNQ